jgi:flagellar biosynthesis/type III secretory pathway protein FliH
MNLSARRGGGRLIRAAASGEDFFLVGEPSLANVETPGAFLTAGDLVRSTEARCAALIAEAEAEAVALVAEARAEAELVRRTAHDDGLSRGLSAGEQQAQSQFAAALDLVRRAANDGKSARDEIAAQATAVVAHAVSLAVRRVTGDYYAQDASRTAHICVEALRAAAGQDVLCIRVNPSVESEVVVALGDSGAFVRSDEAVEIGGCIVDLRNGTIDATLDARLALLDLALNRAGGEVAA